MSQTKIALITPPVGCWITCFLPSTSQRVTSVTTLGCSAGSVTMSQIAGVTGIGRATAERVLADGEKIRLQPMTPFERKVVHDAVADAGLVSESEGEDSNRHVVVLPAS